MPRKVFVANEILTASDVNEFLMDQSVMVFAGTAARGSAIPSPSEGMVTYLEDSNQVQVYNGSSFVAVGGILQVVSTTKSDTFSTSSTGFTDITGLSVSITPTSTSSKIMVFADVAVGANDDSAGPRLLLTRNSTAIARGNAAGSRPRATAGGVPDAISETVTNLYSVTAIGFQFLDEPSTTSALTYVVQIAKSSPGGRVLYVNRNGNYADDANKENSTLISTITVMEVAG